MWKRFNELVYWHTHPIPKELKEFRQSVQINGFEFVMMRATMADIDDMQAIEREAYAGDDPWPRRIFEHELNRTRERLYVVLRQPETNSLVGFMGAAFRPGIREVHLANLTVSPHWQGREIGTFFLSYLITLTKQNHFQRLSLEVETTNERAIKLYEKFDFQIIRERRNYYGPQRNAYDMAQVFSKKQLGRGMN
ncbi:ribosomal-protein-alanine N-acetyltransferase [Weissella uvarum]|uniref:ribosomal protein S18-alanine N-acetyltransferase n=1 Tax=Weissella uvarum TaxID=1479233 RepID=UPI00195F9D18|nr:ribosomal protein S18-alanine N-acetyltransferase [Weissella uvarum]MBM7616787.1 ribosomal-protein-alanine N-acetyltransferase [Weissella uvarum]MCM0594759.1 ribosomal protein S18-alanine N-acetyltransferase [Weissella uvarum]